MILENYWYIYELTLSLKVFRAGSARGIEAQGRLDLPRECPINVGVYVYVPSNTPCLVFQFLSPSSPFKLEVVCIFQIHTDRVNPLKVPSVVNACFFGGTSLPNASACSPQYFWLLNNSARLLIQVKWWHLHKPKLGRKRRKR